MRIRRFPDSLGIISQASAFVNCFLQNFKNFPSAAVGTIFYSGSVSFLLIARIRS